MDQQVSFLTTEDEDDLFVSFALDEHAQTSITLLRTPEDESLLPDEDRGATLSFPHDSNGAPELLQSVTWGLSTVRIIGTANEYTLDISSVEEEDIQEAKRILLKMNFDKRFRLSIV